MMKIGIDALFIRPGKVGGTESYLRNLLKGLEEVDSTNEYYIFTSKSNAATFEFSKDNFKKVECNIDGLNRFKRVIYTSLTLPKIIKSLDLHLVFFPSYIRSAGSLDKVITVSNIQDIQYKHYPQYFSKMQRIIFNIFYPLSLKKSDEIICISDFVKNDIKIEFSDIDNNKLTTIYNPIDFEKFDETTDLSMQTIEELYGLQNKKYILSVASLLPHKNINTLIQAFATFKEKDLADYKLVLVGVKGKSTSELTELISKARVEDSVVIPGFINDNNLNSLYKHAGIFVSTSLFEGFGMPPVEAMYKKIPTITTECASLPEVTQDKAIYYNDPLDYKALAILIADTLENPPAIERLNTISNDIHSAYSLNKIAEKYMMFFEQCYRNVETGKVKK
ncbi:glycosyltransferase family 4 protein [Paenibacillus sp. IHBB 3054]|uniref:glycosyltransferase family 4 protein n=1 Tax=Paenibacillus sp. IHBB 3054 TaxID=3425689 RepID=UPI003F6676F4